MKWWWIKLARYAQPQARGLSLILLLTLTGVGLSLLNPWPLKLIVDYALKDKPLPPGLGWIGALPGASTPRGLLFVLALATVGLFLINRLVDIVQTYIQAGVGSRMVYGLAADLFERLQRQSMLFHGKHRTGDLVRRVTSDSGCARELVMWVYLPVLTSLVTLVSMFFVMWQLSRRLAMLAMVIAVPLTLITRFFAKPMAERKYREKELQGEIAALAEQTLTAVPLIQAFGREEHEEKRFRSLSRRTVQANLRASVSQQQFGVSVGATTAIATMLVVLLGGMSVLNGTLSVGSLIVLLAYFAALYSPLETLAYLSDSFASAAAGARRVAEILESDEERVEDLPGAKPLPVPHDKKPGHVRFDDVTFGYAADRPVLHNITFEAQPGEVVALVGPSGVGKSTLVSLLPRFFDPWQGTISFDGMDVRNTTLSSLRASIAIVLQEPFLLPVTVAENIAYGRPAASREEVVAAAQAAKADQFINNLPCGYESVIGERGITLSGGEKQRLSIARALLKDAPVLILDEPTSALDAETESLLMEAIERLMQGRTTFIIAHRLSTIRRADRIVVLDQGRIVETGTHRELSAASGAYAHLQRLQFGRTNADASPLANVADKP